jgi:hypothetical protein
MQYTDALNRGDNRTFGTQMAPGLLNSSQGYGSAQGMSQYGPQSGGQGGQNSYQPLPVNFGGSQGGQGNGGGGLLTDGPFTAPAPVVKPPEEVKPVAPTAAQTNRPFDLQQFTDNFYTDFANGTATPEQIAEFNNITSRNYG